MANKNGRPKKALAEVYADARVKRVLAELYKYAGVAQRLPLISRLTELGETVPRYYIGRCVQHGLAEYGDGDTVRLTQLAAELHVAEGWEDDEAEVEFNF